MSSFETGLILIAAAGWGAAFFFWWKAAGWCERAHEELESRKEMVEDFKRSSDRLIAAAREKAREVVDEAKGAFILGFTDLVQGSGDVIIRVNDRHEVEHFSFMPGEGRIVVAEIGGKETVYEGSRPLLH